jgi:hypothetical protein
MPDREIHHICPSQVTISTTTSAPSADCPTTHVADSAILAKSTCAQNVVSVTTKSAMFLTRSAPTARSIPKNSSNSSESAISPWVFVGAAIFLILGGIAAAFWLSSHGY